MQWFICYINIKGFVLPMEKITLFDSAYEHYRRVSEKMESAVDIQEQIQIFRRLTNLLSDMESLLSGPELPN